MVTGIIGKLQSEFSLNYILMLDRYFSSPDLPPLFVPDGFQGNDIRIDGEVVAQLCHERLSQDI